MMITPQKTEKLFLEGHQRFESLGFSMLLMNLKTFHRMDPSKYTLEDCTSTLNAFLEKFKAVMTRDCEIIEKL